MKPRESLTSTNNELGVKPFKDSPLVDKIQTDINVSGRVLE